MKRPQLDLRLLAISDLRAVADPHSTLEALIRGGITALMVREKHLSDEALIAAARPLAELCRRHRVGFLINRSLAAAQALAADGLHLGFDAPSLAEARAALGPAPLLGVSAHASDDLAALRAAGADYATYSPIFATASKPDSPALGLESLTLACRTGLPLVALGGITPANALACRRAGAVGVAAIGALWHAPDPEQAARALGSNS